jgi:hypothetical protein
VTGGHRIEFHLRGVNLRGSICVESISLVWCNLKMMWPEWCRDAGKRAKVIALLVLALAACWSVFRLSRSLNILFSVSNDLYTYYSIWSLLQYRDLADIALRQSLYLPHTWLAFTPLFVFGWPAARLLMLGVNLAAVLYICARLAQLTNLQGVRRWLLLAFFCSWLGTGLVIGLGNLALVCVAAVLAAFPFSSPQKQVSLAFSAMKQSLVFPVYLQLLFKRPKVLLIPFAIFGVCGVAALLWARLSIPEAIKMARSAGDSVGTWTQYDHLCLRRLFVPFVKDPQVISLLKWLVWFGMFGAIMRLVKDPLAQLAAFLLLSLLPLYHNTYDMVAAAPALAIFLKRCRLFWPTLLTVLLASNVASPVARFAPPPLKPFAEGIAFAYFPLVIISILLGLVLLERSKIAEPNCCPERPADGTAPEVLTSGRAD